MSSGNDIYTLLPSSNVFVTIFDEGGTDRITGSGSTGMTINLQMVGPILDEEGGSNLSSINGVMGGFSVAVGTVIEEGVSGDGADNVIGNFASNLLITGFGEDTLMGMGGADTLQAGPDNDTLDGGAAGDSMLGGLGDDTYYVDSVFDRVVEFASAGIDHVFSSVNYELRSSSQNSENLTLTGNANLNGTGNALNNVITGNAGRNVLNGAFGNDTLIGGDGVDRFEDDAGADRMEGGLGNDIYIVDNAFDVYVELIGEGFDRVESSVSLALRDQSQFVEALWLTGDADLDGTGNALGNVVRGNTGDNVINGAFGNDTLVGLAGNDTFRDDGGADRMDGGFGNDVYDVDNIGDVVIEEASAGFDRIESLISFDLNTQAQQVEALWLLGADNLDGTGNALNNIIRGSFGDNVINGGLGDDTLIGLAGDDQFLDVSGADRMEGGPGNDLYRVDNAADVVIEFAGGGIDTVESALGAGNYALPAHVEVLQLIGGAAGAAMGNAAGNEISGNSGDNLLRSFRGEDVLAGGEGSDTLAGGIGRDVFVFTADTEVDRVRDFGKGKDRIELEADSFTALEIGALPEEAFAYGTGATEAEQRILYNPNTGALRYDADGSGDTEAVLFGWLSGAPDLTADDISVA